MRNLKMGFTTNKINAKYEKDDRDMAKQASDNARMLLLLWKTDQQDATTKKAAMAS